MKQFKDLLIYLIRDYCFFNLFFCFLFVIHSALKNHFILSLHQSTSGVVFAVMGRGPGQGQCFSLSKDSFPKEGKEYC